MEDFSFRFEIIKEGLRTSIWSLLYPFVMILHKIVRIFYQHNRKTMSFHNLPDKAKKIWWLYKILNFAEWTEPFSFNNPQKLKIIK